MSKQCHIEGCRGWMGDVIGNDISHLSNGADIVTENVLKEVCNICGECIISAKEYNKIEKRIAEVFPDYFNQSPRRRATTHPHPYNQTA